ncbi:MAG: cytochrome P450 [Chloroflexi bacterium]|nr:MAG: cytochrome P450 [Chloroflexota bacterium]
MSKSPEEILGAVDLFAEDQREHLLDALAVARRECPVLRTEADGGYYLVTRYDDVRAVCQNPDLFSSADPSIRSQPVRVIPLDVDPPDHGRYRRFLNPYFSRSFLLRYEAQMREIARDAIAAFIDRGRLEVVHDYAVPLTAGSLARVVFATENIDLIRRAAASVRRVALELAPEAFQELAVLSMEAMAEAEQSPEGREDVLSALVRETVGGRPLTTEERLSIITTLLLGGLDTTRGVIVNIAYHLATGDGVEAALRRPERWDAALDEFLRYETTVSFIARTVTRDTELAGIPLSAGDRIAIHFLSANRDAGRFERADELVLDRESNQHVAFGHGVHRCLGAHFARIQLGIAFEELLARATRFRLLEGAAIPRQTGMVLNSPTELHLTFDRR